jgi:hypothetical protein
MSDHWRGLRGLGADVRVCAPPDEDFAALLERVGVRWCRWARRCARW